MMDHAEIEQYTIPLEIKNGMDKPMRVFIEPWTDEYWLLPGESLVIVTRGPKADFPAVECVHNTLDYEHVTFVYIVWNQSKFAVYKNGKLISEPLEECPREPSGISQRRMQETLTYLGEA